MEHHLVQKPSQSAAQQYLLDHSQSTAVSGASRQVMNFRRHSPRGTQLESKGRCDKHRL